MPVLHLKHINSIISLKDTIHVFKNMINYLQEQGQKVPWAQDATHTHTKEIFELLLRKAVGQAAVL